MKKPPKKLSKLIRLALSDLKKVERSKKYEVNMDFWHWPKLTDKNDNHICFVCLAGSVMAMTRKAEHGFVFDPDLDNIKWRYAYHAINSARQGRISQAASYLDKPVLKYLKFNRVIVDYHSDPKLFRKQLFQLCRDLEKARL